MPISQAEIDAIKVAADIVKTQTDKLTSIINPYATGSPPPGNNYFVDQVNGSDSNNGTSEATAWQTWAKAAAFIYTTSANIFLKAGMQIAGYMQVPVNASVDIYGGSTKATVSNLRDIKGVAADWTQEPTNPTAWTRTIPAGQADRDWVIYNGNATYQGKVFSVAAVNGPGKYYRGASTRVTVYSLTNPATAYSTLQNIVDAGGGLLWRSITVASTVRNIIFKGHRLGIHTTDNKLVEDCEIWFTSAGGLILGGNESYVWRTPSYYTGTKEGGHGIYAAPARPIAGVPFTARNYVYDSPNFAAGEDNFQQIVGAGELPGDIIETHLIATAPKSMWLWKSPENCIDVKAGKLYLEGPGMASCSATQQATGTTQGHSHGVVNRGWSLRHAGQFAALQMQEWNSNRFDSEKSFYYSERGTAWISALNGQAHTSALDVFWSPRYGAAAFGGGSFAATHSTFIGGLYHGLSAALGPQGGTFTITHDGVNVGGNYTATITENHTGSAFGDGATILISGLTGASAAYNGVRTLSAANNTPGKATFPISAASSPPAPADVTGILVQRLGILGTLRNCLFVGGDRPLTISTANNLPTSLTGANCLSKSGTGYNRVAHYNGRNYTAAQAISDANVVNNLKFDSGSKAGGSTWKAEETTSVVNLAFPFDAGTISVENGVATVTSPVVPIVGQPVGITGSTNVDLHGVHFVKSVGSGFFTFDANYDEPNASAKACSVTQFKPKSTSVSFRTAPTIPLGTITTDALGQPVDGPRNFGAVTWT